MKFMIISVKSHTSSLAETVRGKNKNKTLEISELVGTSAYLTLSFFCGEYLVSLEKRLAPDNSFA